MCHQSRIRLLAPTTPRGRERVRSDVLEKAREGKGRETTIRAASMVVIVVDVVFVVVLFEHRVEIPGSNWPVVV